MIRLYDSYQKSGYIVSSPAKPRVKPAHRHCELGRAWQKLAGQSGPSRTVRRAAWNGRMRFWISDLFTACQEGFSNREPGWIIRHTNFTDLFQSSGLRTSLQGVFIKEARYQSVQLSDCLVLARHTLVRRFSKSISLRKMISKSGEAYCRWLKQITVLDAGSELWPVLAIRIVRCNRKFQWNGWSSNTVMTMRHPLTSWPFNETNTNGETILMFGRFIWLSVFGKRSLPDALRAFADRTGQI